MSLLEASQRRCTHGTCLGSRVCAWHLQANQPYGVRGMAAGRGAGCEVDGARAAALADAGGQEVVQRHTRPGRHPMHRRLRRQPPERRLAEYSGLNIRVEGLLGNPNPPACQLIAACGCMRMATDHHLQAPD